MGGSGGARESLQQSAVPTLTRSVSEANGAVSAPVLKHSPRSRFGLV